MKKIILLLSLAVFFGPLYSKENPGKKPTKQQSTEVPSPMRNVAASCTPATAQTDLNINNIRTTILNGGDMWWNLADGQYEVPKGGNRHSMFAGALWVGGWDAGGQLKVAAMTYRQTGSDFWPGPLDPSTASIDDATCAAFDEHYLIFRTQVDEYVAYLACQNDPSCDVSESFPGYVIPSIITDWPGNSPYSEVQSQLAPYHDERGDGVYDPTDGDYPRYDVGGNLDCKSESMLFGDQTLWWVFNDRGNIHTETGAEPIGLEIRAQAFAFATNDEINNMTFYQYQVINQSSITLNDTYFGQWVDPDLGNYQDDYVGCDVDRGLGYCYNGDAVDEGATGYGENPPSIGVDFFQGPLADPGDGIDNNRDGVIDEPGEEIIMSKFVYYNNNFTVTGNPENASHFYNYLNGIWKDGTGIVRNGTNGHPPTGGTGPTADFMFPGDTDPAFPGDIWTEETAENTPADRRFLQSAGVFTLEPGAVNYITTGVVWARTTSGGPFASVELMRLADDKAQAIFDNCFRVLNGPDAPDLAIRELENSLIITLSNRETSNNYLGSYEEVDPLIIGYDDTTYRFQGYQIFQLADKNLSITDIYNPDLARLVAQCDIEDGVAQLVNYEFDQALGAPVPQDMTIAASDDGIAHSFEITQDQFASGDRTLVNHKIYFYTALAYGYNNYKTYNPTDPNALDGQKKPYKAGRRNIRAYGAIPHRVEAENGGTFQASVYGDGPQIVRLDGTGNAGLRLDFTQETMDEIVSNYNMANPKYKNGAGPVNVKVIDPLLIPKGSFEMIFDGISGGSNWVLINNTTGKTVKSEATINLRNEQLIPDWGLSVQVIRQPNPGQNDETNGFIEASLTFEDPANPWLFFLPDVDIGTPLNWIRSGTATGDCGDQAGIDDEEVYENVLGGTWGPYRLASTNSDPTTGCNSGPAFKFNQLANIANLNSVDVVFTSDKSKWTRVPVVETQDETALAEGGVEKMSPRAGTSLDKNGNPQSGSTGWGWFPGYAVDLELGIRVNIIMGEDSRLISENGNDMLFNPTGNVATPLGDFLMGGKHYLYIMGTEYAGDNEMDNPHYDAIMDPTDLNKRNMYAECRWVSIPMATPGYEWLNNDVTVSLRVSKRYDIYEVDGGINNGIPHYGFVTDDIAVETGNVTTAKSELSNVRVVPNPYYAYSDYEQNQLDNRVKITNLPDRCVVSIYTVNGTLIRRYDKDSPDTFLEWDLKNGSNIPIASGLYVIHVEVEGVGEAYVKWFGSMRPVDLDTF